MSEMNQLSQEDENRDTTGQESFIQFTLKENLDWDLNFIKKNISVRHPNGSYKTYLDFSGNADQK